MRFVLVDTSAWIAYFNGDERVRLIDFLIETNRISTNELILSELLPFIQMKKESELVELLKMIKRLPMEIDWEEIRSFQLKNLQKGINGVGIPDLLILQNALLHKAELLSLDKHFPLMANHLDDNPLQVIITE